VPVPGPAAGPGPGGPGPAATAAIAALLVHEYLPAAAAAQAAPPSQAHPPPWNGISADEAAIRWLLRIVAVFHLPLAQAAAELGIGQEQLRIRCRALGVARWPHRRLVGDPEAEPGTLPGMAEFAVEEARKRLRRN
jgi:hypothetical protein